MPRRNHSRRTRLQQQLDPLLEAFLDSWMKRSWLLVGDNIADTTTSGEESFDGVYSPEYNNRASITELRTLVSAGVSIEYIRAFDRDGNSRYPVDAVLDAHRNGLAPEFALAALGC